MVKMRIVEIELHDETVCLTRLLQHFIALIQSGVLDVFYTKNIVRFTTGTATRTWGRRVWRKIGP